MVCFLAKFYFVPVINAYGNTNLLIQNTKGNPFLTQVSTNSTLPIKSSNQVANGFNVKKPFFSFHSNGT